MIFFAGQFLSYAATTWYSEIFLLSFVTCFACDIGQYRQRFGWGHHHLHLVDMGWMITRSADYFITCSRHRADENKLDKVETALHGCNSWFSVWTLSCRCPLSFLRSISLASLFSSRFSFDWSDLLQILRKPAAFSFAAVDIIEFKQFLYLCMACHAILIPRTLVVTHSNRDKHARQARRASSLHSLMLSLQGAV